MVLHSTEPRVTPAAWQDSVALHRISGRVEQLTFHQPAKSSVQPNPVSRLYPTLGSCSCSAGAHRLCFCALRAKRSNTDFFNTPHFFNTPPLPSSKTLTHRHLLWWRSPLAASHTFPHPTPIHIHTSTPLTFGRGRRLRQRNCIPPPLPPSRPHIHTCARQAVPARRVAHGRLLRAAVLLVLTARGLGHWAAAPLHAHAE